MRTRTLLLTAAATFVSAAVMAQVVSVNVVGFVNLNLKSGYNLIVNPLSVSNATTDTISSILPAPANGTQLIKWDGANQTFAGAITYDTDIFGGWEDPSVPIGAGEGFFLKVPADITVTFVGEVRQGVYGATLYQGYSIAGSAFPLGGADVASGGVSTALHYTPNNGDQVLKWDSANQTYFSALTYDTDIFGGWEAEPIFAIGDAAFFIRQAAGSWTYDFKVQ